MCFHSSSAPFLINQNVQPFLYCAASTSVNIEPTNRSHMQPTETKTDENVELDDKDKGVTESRNADDPEDDDDASDDGPKDGRAKKRKKDLSEDERLEERRAANRRSALESRQRRKNLIESLQKQVEQLTKETTELRAVNDTLRLQLDSSLAENQQFRLVISQQQLAAGGGAGLAGFGQNPGLLLGRGGLNPALAGVQQGMFGGLGGINPALLGGLGAGYGAGFGAGAGFGGAADFQAQLQLQQQRDVAAAMGLAPNTAPQAEPPAAPAAPARGGNNATKARTNDEENVAAAVGSM